MHMRYPVRSALVGCLVILAPGIASASYIGPGLGLGLIGTALGVVGAILLGIASILWYPVKRLVRRMRPAQAAARSAARGRD